MKPAALTFAFAIAAFTPSALADIPPMPPEDLPRPEASDAVIARSAAGLADTSWGMELKAEREAFEGDLKFLPGNRFTLTVRELGGSGDRGSKSGSGVWGVVEANAENEFVLILSVIEDERDGEFDADEVIALRLKGAGVGDKLVGTLIDDDNKATVTLTRR